MSKKWTIYYAAIVIVTGLTLYEMFDRDQESAFYKDMRQHHAGADDVYRRVLDFMDKGGRFTKERGDALEARIEKLEEQAGEEE